MALATGTGPDSAQHRLQRLRRQPGRHPRPGEPGRVRRAVRPAAWPGRWPRSLIFLAGLGSGTARPLRRRRPAAGVPMKIASWRPSDARALRDRSSCLQSVVSACSLFSYSPTPLPTTPTAQPRRPRASSSVQRRPEAVRQPAGVLRPARRPAQPGQPAVRLDHGQDPRPRPADRRGFGRHLPAGFAQPADRPDRGLRHRHGQGRGQGDLRRRERLPADGDHRRPADPGAAGGPGRHGGPQHDDQLRPLDPDRLLQRVLPLRPEDPGPQGIQGHHAGRSGRPEGLRAARAPPRWPT